MRRNSVASLASLLEPVFACPTCPLPHWDSRLSAFVVGLHPLPGHTHHNPNSKPYGIVSNHGKDTNSDAIKTIDSFFRSAVPICAAMYFKSTRSIRWLQPLCDRPFCLNKHTKHCPKEDEIDPSQNAGLDASMDIVTQKDECKKVQNTRYRRDTSVFKKGLVVELYIAPSDGTIRVFRGKPLATSVTRLSESQRIRGLGLCKVDKGGTWRQGPLK